MTNPHLGTARVEMPQYAEAEKAVERKHEANEIRLYTRAVKRRWPMTAVSRQACVALCEKVRDDDKQDQVIRMKAVSILKDMEAQNQTDDLNAEKMARLDAMKPTEIIAANSTPTDDELIDAAIARGLVDRLPARQREIAEKKMLENKKTE